MFKPLTLASVVVIGTVCASGQTSAYLSAKYVPLSAYEVRPGVLMTATYGEDGQVCVMTIEKRHSSSKRADIDLSSKMPAKLVDELTDELVPPAERGPAKSKWLDDDSYVAGGVSYTKRSFENVSIEIHGSTSESCDGGDEVVIIRWTKRSCGNSVATLKQPSR
jgi:hypothetical protein